MNKYFILIVFVTFFLFSCEKDEITSTGTLVVQFDDPHRSLSVYPLENQIRPLFDLYSGEKKTISKRMNVGNYYCVVGDIDTDFPGVVFQIQLGKTTKISYNSEASPNVTYE